MVCLIKFIRDSCLFPSEVSTNGSGWETIVGDDMKGARNRRSCV